MMTKPVQPRWTDKYLSAKLAKNLSLEARSLQVKGAETFGGKSRQSQSPPKVQRYDSIESKFEKVKVNFANITTKSFSSVKGAKQTNSGRASGQASSKSGGLIPDDLQMVMDSSDLNFKKKKVFGVDPVKIREKTKRRMELTAMRNTLREGQNSALFPSIVFEEKRVLGTADGDQTLNS